MKSRKKKLLAIALFAALLLAAFLVPIDSYTTRYGCKDGAPPQKRLHLIRGDSIAKVQSEDTEPMPHEGCSPNARYVLYIL